MLSRAQPRLQARSPIKGAASELGYRRPFAQPPPAIKRSPTHFQLRCGFFLREEVCQEVFSDAHLSPFIQCWRRCLILVETCGRQDFAIFGEDYSRRPRSQIFNSAVASSCVRKSAERFSGMLSRLKFRRQQNHVRGDARTEGFPQFWEKSFPPTAILRRKKTPTYLARLFERLLRAGSRVLHRHNRFLFRCSALLLRESSRRGRQRGCHSCWFETRAASIYLFQRDCVGHRQNPRSPWCPCFSGHVASGSLRGGS